MLQQSSLACSLVALRTRKEAFWMLGVGWSSALFVRDPPAPLNLQAWWRSSDCCELFVTQARYYLHLMGLVGTTGALVYARPLRPLAQPLETLVMSCPSGDAFRSVSRAPQVWSGSSRSSTFSWSI